MSVSTVTAKTVSSIAAMAIGRLRGLFSAFLSMNGSNSNIITAFDWNFILINEKLFTSILKTHFCY